MASIVPIDSFFIKLSILTRLSSPFVSQSCPPCPQNWSLRHHSSPCPAAWPGRSAPHPSCSPPPATTMWGRCRRATLKQYQSTQITYKTMIKPENCRHKLLAHHPAFHLLTNIQETPCPESTNLGTWKFIIEKSPPEFSDFFLTF